MRITDEEIVAALLSHGTNRAAAEALGMKERSLYNRVRLPTFKAKLEEAKAQLLHSATDAAQSRLNDAIRVMDEVMRDELTAAGTRVNAADALIRNALKLMEVADISKRMDELEQMLKEVEERR